VLALGIGAATAIYAFVDATLVKPLPYREPARLVALFEHNPVGDRFHLSDFDYRDGSSATMSSCRSMCIGPIATR
jgi:macrolide transport system ATP-binding/permease protein